MGTDLNFPLNFKYYYSHAKHNFEMCEEIRKIKSQNNEDRFHDWVVTTAFYSGIHFIYAYCFKDKFVHNQINYVYFDAYFNDVKDYFKGSRHRVTCNLASERMPDGCSSSIEFLYKDSKSARYNNYQVNVAIANESYLKLVHLKIQADKKIEPSKG